MVLVAALTAMSLAACGGGNSAETEAAARQKQQPRQRQQLRKAERPRQLKGKRETMLFYTGFIGDFGIADMGWRACQAAAEKYGYDLTLVEYGQDTSQAINSLVDALDTSHYDYVVASGWYITDTIIEMCENGEWADITFVLYDTSPLDDFSNVDNIYGISFAQNEGSFPCSCLLGTYDSDW